MYFYSAGAVAIHKAESLHTQVPSTPAFTTVDILGKHIMYIWKFQKSNFL